MNFQERKLEADPLSRDDPRCVSFLARSRESRFSRSTTSLDTSVTEQTPTTLSASSANSFSSKGNYEGPFEEEGRWSAPTKKGERKGFLGKDRCDLTNGSGSDPATNFPPPPKNEKKEGEDQEETQTEEELDLTSSTGSLFFFYLPNQNFWTLTHFVNNQMYLLLTFRKKNGTRVHKSVKQLGFYNISLLKQF